MPGAKREVENARDEGVQFVFHQQRIAILGEQQVSVVRFRNSLDQSHFELAADVVITAFGFQASPADWLTAHGVALHDNGRIHTTQASAQVAQSAVAQASAQVARSAVAHAGTLPFQTSNPKIFAGGDNVRGADLVVNAVHDGREAGLSIARWLRARQLSSATSLAQHQPIAPVALGAV